MSETDFLQTIENKRVATGSLHSKTRIGMLSLGCPKTLVDSENILGKLSPNAYRITSSVADCDIALLNTCAFIQDAQEESVNRILELIALKKSRQIKAVIVMGCLVQRYPKELQKELNEVDAFIGSGEYDKIPEIIGQVQGGHKVFTVKTPGYLATSTEKRVALTPGHYRYLKISEGCDHICTFCTIPSFRGKHRSREMNDILNEAKLLQSEGAKELILTGQDTTFYGRDHNRPSALSDLIRALDQLEGIEWIRLLYAYPSCINHDLIRAMKESRRMCHYLDMPLQHASDNMLSAMKRGITKQRTVDLIKRFRDEVPDLAIRTTFIVGFPGETENDFEELMGFMQDMKFERLGIFTYSQETGTPAAVLPNQVPEKIKEQRLDRAMRLQQEISAENNKRFIGKTLKVLVDEKEESSKNTWIARSMMDAPDVDGNVLIQSQKKLQIGSFYEVKISATREYDLVGKIA